MLRIQFKPIQRHKIILRQEQQPIRISNKIIKKHKILNLQTGPKFFPIKFPPLGHIRQTNLIILNRASNTNDSNFRILLSRQISQELSDGLFEVIVLLDQ